MKIFICYAREDYEIAGRLYDDLKAANVTPWMDKKDILVGQNWKQEIRQAIHESSYFIVLLSENSLSKKGYVQKELKTALDILDNSPVSEMFILPVRLDECHPADERLLDIHWVDLFPSYDEGLNQVLRVFGSEKKETPDPVRSPKMGDDGRGDIAFAKNKGNAGIVKDSQADIISQNVNIEGGIHYHHYHDDIKDVDHARVGNVAISFLTIALTSFLIFLFVFRYIDINPATKPKSLWEIMIAVLLSALAAAFMALVFTRIYKTISTWVIIFILIPPMLLLTCEKFACWQKFVKK